MAGLFTPSAPACEFGGACHDFQDVMQWLVGDDPALDAINTGKLAAAGHSMRALSLLNYLWYQGHGGPPPEHPPQPL